MKTKFKHIYFKKIEQKAKTSMWICSHNISHLELGIIEWYAPWRQYVFYPSDGTLFSGGCLDDIIAFMKDLRAHELAERKK